jgi:hypothetical protein
LFTGIEKGELGEPEVTAKPGKENGIDDMEANSGRKLFTLE